VSWLSFILALLTELIRVFAGGVKAPQNDRAQMILELRKTRETLDAGWKKAQDTGDTSDLERID
jgi:hypothetical protein